MILDCPFALACCESQAQEYYADQNSERRNTISIDFGGHKALHPS